MTGVFNFDEERVARRGKEMRKPTVFDVANYFLSCVDESAGSVMTHLKLQKLCYYAQAWNMVFNNEPLFDGRFEAWVHGPVCPSLWQKYKDNCWLPISIVKDFNVKIFQEEQIETLEAVWNAYGQFDGRYLEDITHQEEPWIKARRGLDPGEPCNNEITLTAMKNYYSKLVNE